MRQEANVAIIEDLVRGIAVGVRNFVLENRGDIFSCIPSVPLTTRINIEKGGNWLRTRESNPRHQDDLI